MKALSVGIMLVMLLSISAIAQTPVLGKVNVPFAFTVNGQPLGSGVYEVRNIGHGQYQIRNVENNSGVMIVTHSTISRSEGIRLIFRAYGDEYFLGEISDAALRLSASFSKSRAESVAAERYKDRTMVALALTR